MNLTDSELERTAMEYLTLPSVYKYYSTFKAYCEKKIMDKEMDLFNVRVNLIAKQGVGIHPLWRER